MKRWLSIKTEAFRAEVEILSKNEEMGTGQIKIFRLKLGFERDWIKGYVEILRSVALTWSCGV